jgi:hypothetical protein
VEITVSNPRAHACSASVPITSSASTPETSTMGQPSAAIVSRSGAICEDSSSGIACRVALYSE